MKQSLAGLICVLTLLPTSLAWGQPPTSGLRGVYLGPASDAQSFVGRLAIRSQGRTLPINHPFRAGDSIQFQISSNLDGFVYVFHQAGGAEPDLLWPTPESHGNNRVERHKSRLVPGDRPIVFDRTSGVEEFFVLISDCPDASCLDALTYRDDDARRTEPAAWQQGGEKQPEMQIIVRDPKRAQMVGTMLSSLADAAPMETAGPSADDPFVYFAASGHGERNWALAHFSLEHVADSKWAQ